MAKKSTTPRQTNAARRTQPANKAGSATLVRTTGAASGAVAEPETTPAAPATVEKSTPKVQPRTPAPSRAANPAPQPMPAAPRMREPKSQSARIARARATQQARNANLITPEHYAYVRNDVRLTGILAAAMFAAIVVLRFILG